MEKKNLFKMFVCEEKMSFFSMDPAHHALLGALHQKMLNY